MLVIANARVFGGGFKIAPDADLSDGRLDAVAFANMPLLAPPADAWRRLLRGTHRARRRSSTARSPRFVPALPRPARLRDGRGWTRARRGRAHRGRGARRAAGADRRGPSPDGAAAQLRSALSLAVAALLVPPRLGASSAPRDRARGRSSSRASASRRAGSSTGWPGCSSPPSAPGAPASTSGGRFRPTSPASSSANHQSIIDPPRGDRHGRPARPRLRGPDAVTPPPRPSSARACASSAARWWTRSGTPRARCAVAGGRRADPAHGPPRLPGGPPHRWTGRSGRARPAGLAAVLGARRLPVYLVVEDGFWQGRRLVDFALERPPHARCDRRAGPLRPRPRTRPRSRRSSRSCGSG